MPLISKDTLRGAALVSLGFLGLTPACGDDETSGDANDRGEAGANAGSGGEAQGAGGDTDSAGGEGGSPGGEGGSPGGEGGSPGAEVGGTAGQSTGAAGEGGATGGTVGEGGEGGLGGPPCGDGVVEGDEDCDDGNDQSGDGCDDCVFETGFTCSTDAPTLCEPLCGDGALVGAELEAGRCDDGGTVSSDGCDSECSVEPGWACSGEPSDCVELCGDGTLVRGEACDDGNAEPSDGCSECSVEPGWSCDGEPSVCAALPDANVLISGVELAALSTLDPASIAPAVSITGLEAGYVLVSIDRRPNNGMLYGLGFNSVAGSARLYSVSSVTGYCTAVGSEILGGVTGTQFGMDVSPAVDRVRVVSDTGVNCRINPNTGTFVVDTPIGGATTVVQETAYTNNGINQTVTTQYTLSSVTDSLYIQNPPNAGTQTVPVPLMVDLDSVGGFDISAGVDVTTPNEIAAGAGLAILRLAGEDEDSLVRLDLTTGEPSGAVPIGSDVVGLAVQDTSSLPMIGLSATGTELLRFSSASPDTVATATITGVTAGEVLVGIDWRPQTGQLYALGINAAMDQGTLYIVDPQGGVVTAVGSAGLISLADTEGAPLDLPAASAGYGFDFNPTIDRIRVVAGTGPNFRLNPVSGAPVDGDTGALGVNPDTDLAGARPGSTGPSGAAHTNSYGQTLTGGFTTLYVLDATGDGFEILASPNEGTATGFQEVTLDSAPLDFEEVGGFDFADDVRVRASGAPAVGLAYAALTVDGTTRLYAIDLGSGAATDLGLIGDGDALAGLAVGHAGVE